MQSSFSRPLFAANIRQQFHDNKRNIAAAGAVALTLATAAGSYQLGQSSRDVIVPPPSAAATAAFNNKLDASLTAVVNFQDTGTKRAECVVAAKFIDSAPLLADGGKQDALARSAQQALREANISMTPTPPCTFKGAVTAPQNNL